MRDPCASRSEGATTIDRRSELSTADRERMTVSGFCYQ
jgi:hypothetical protein